MVCEKCGYKDKKEVEKQGHILCSFCARFAPNDKMEEYIADKVDWKLLESFRHSPSYQKQGMEKKAAKGSVMCRPALGYSLINGKLKPNEQSAKIHSLFKTFLNKNYSLNSLAKNYGLSVNGLKKVLTNRTYLGEIKFSGKLYKGNHPPIISPEIFYAVQRKLKEMIRS
ncbi:MAG: recombinase family protein [Candidatus Nanoarchaeia archaeon]